MKKFLRIAIPIVIIILAVFLWWRFYFVFGEGVKAGELNRFVNKGYMFKTYEGRLIQTGLKTTVPGAIQSNEFLFSVTSDSIATILEGCSGKEVELRYKEYLHTVPWRGMSVFVVYEVIKIKEPENDGLAPF